LTVGQLDSAKSGRIKPSDQVANNKVMLVIKVRCPCYFHLDQFYVQMITVLLYFRYMFELKTGQYPSIFVKFRIISGVVNIYTNYAKNI